MKLQLIRPGVKTIVRFCLFDGVKRHFQPYFIYIVAVSFIGGEKSKLAGPRKKPLTCRKSLTNFITFCCTLHTGRDSNSQHQSDFVIDT